MEPGLSAIRPQKTVFIELQTDESCRETKNLAVTGASWALWKLSVLNPLNLRVFDGFYAMLETLLSHLTGEIEHQTKAN